MKRSSVISTRTVYKGALTAVALSAMLLTAGVASASEPYRLETMGAIEARAGSGDFAPYYMTSNRYGVDGVSPYAAYLRGRVVRSMTDSTRFDYGFGVDLMAGYVSPIEYERYDRSTGSYYRHGVSSGYWYPQQLYGEVRYRGMFLYAGMKEENRGLYPELGSGDLVMSRNARPVPQVRLGFSDFEDVPFTRGWLQVQGELAFGRFIDDGWKRRQFNYWNSFYTEGVWLHYKRLYFRIGGHERFSFTLGMQHAAQFGGRQYIYRDGELVKEERFPDGIVNWLKIFVPVQNEGSAYYDGNHVGSWDLKASYRLSSGSVVEAYTQWLWEDGSGIGKLNGWDGVWGLRYKSGRRSWVNEAVAEYIDLTNQSGPIHWAPDDYPGVPIPGQATGSDDYYNNYAYPGWSNYGMSMGSAFVKSPAYNLSGYPRFLDNRVRGFHIGVSGSPSERWDYTLLFSHRTSWGTPFVPASHRRHSTSMLLGGSWSSPSVSGLKVRASVGFDVGKLYGDNFGVEVGVVWTPTLFIKRGQKL